MIQAIETQYRGYRFRSRLEARWAVFFDALGLEWEYEKEGYDLGKAGWYLPDFWLPEFEIWLEVKGADPTLEELAKSTAMQNLGEVIGFLRNVEPVKKSQIHLPELTVFGRCAECNDIVVAIRSHNECHFKHKRRCTPYFPFCTPLYFDAFILKSYIAARSARFEHGENGVPRTTGKS